MTAAQCIERLGGWEGYRLFGRLRTFGKESAGACWNWRPRRRWRRRCSGCSRFGASVHDQKVRRVRRLPIFETPVEPVVPRFRLDCPRCGPKLEALDWLEPYAGDQPTREERRQAVQGHVSAACGGLLRLGMEHGQAGAPLTPASGPKKQLAFEGVQL